MHEWVFNFYLKSINRTDVHLRIGVLKLFQYVGPKTEKQHFYESSGFSSRYEKWWGLEKQHED